MHEQKKRPAMPGAGRPATAEKSLRDLELSGLNTTLSIIAQNIIEFGGQKEAKSNLYQKINKYQPEFLGAVKNIVK
jgi:hypothetical protein